ncbi:MAG: hypothetical protein H7255_11295 [Ramlibacter sp.]|nr:hypothetical protein [Ramlibacter sp.]
MSKKMAKHLPTISHRQRLLAIRLCPTSTQYEWLHRIGSSFDCAVVPVAGNVLSAGRASDAKSI